MLLGPVHHQMGVTVVGRGMIGEEGYPLKKRKGVRVMMRVD